MKKETVRNTLYLPAISFPVSPNSLPNGSIRHLHSPMCGVKTITTVLILLTTVLIAISAGKAGKRYGMMATKQTLTSPPALLPRPFPERFQTGNSREVPLFHFVRKKAKTKDKCNPFQTDCRLTLPAVTKNYFQETIRQFLFVRILGQNREKPVEKTAETAKTGKNTAVFHRIGLPHSG